MQDEESAAGNLGKVTVFAVIVFLGIAVWSPLSAYDSVRVNSDTTAELQNEESIAVSPVDDDVLVGVWRDFRLGYRSIGIGVSYDGGQTWSDSLETALPH